MKKRRIIFCKTLSLALMYFQPWVLSERQKAGHSEAEYEPGQCTFGSSLCLLCQKCPRLLSASSCSRSATLITSSPSTVTVWELQTGCQPAVCASPKHTHLCIYCGAETHTERPQSAWWTRRRQLLLASLQSAVRSSSELLQSLSTEIINKTNKNIQHDCLEMFLWCFLEQERPYYDKRWRSCNSC